MTGGYSLMTRRSVLGSCHGVQTRGSGRLVTGYLARPLGRRIMAH